MTSRFAPLLATMALLGCSEAPASPDSESANLTSKTTVLALTPDIRFGEKVTGMITEPQFDAWKIALKRGNRITVTERVTEGTMEPDFGAFIHGQKYVSSDDYEVDGKTLSKDYTAPQHGTYYFAVAAKQGTGSGTYELDVRCTGGPCKGDDVGPIVMDLDEGLKNVCISMARGCAFEALPGLGGILGPVTARKLWNECLSEAILTKEVPGDVVSCSTACEGDEAEATCDAIVEMLPFYADQPAACVDELEYCLHDCQSGKGSDTAGVEYQCLVGGFNGTCDSYAKGHMACGGTYVDETPEQCHALCESTFGAWHDDLNTVCTEECGEYPEE